MLIKNCKAATGHCSRFDLSKIDPAPPSAIIMVWKIAVFEVATTAEQCGTPQVSFTAAEARKTSSHSHTLSLCILANL